VDSVASEPPAADELDCRVSSILSVLLESSVESVSRLFFACWPA